MRYIRTQDGKIFDTQYEPKAFKYNWNAKFIIDDNNLIVYDTVFKDRIANHGQILKQSDTIEELIDEFVDTSELKVSSTSTGGWLYDEFDSKNKCLIYYVEDERRTISLNEFDDLSKIYGAIWTDKGLQFVARMNTKRELELL